MALPGGAAVIRPRGGPAGAAAAESRGKLHELHHELPASC